MGAVREPRQRGGSGQSTGGRDFLARFRVKVRIRKHEAKV